MDAEVLLAGAFIFAAGIGIGRFLPPRPKGFAKSPKPVCGCEHHYSMHDKTGKCRVQYQVVSRIMFIPVDWHEATCPCARYSGPVPLPEVFAPEIAS